MRTTFRIYSAAAVFTLGTLVSCQRQELDIQETEILAGKELVPVTLNASIVQTKVSYTETSFNLQPAWTGGETVIGFDEGNTSYEFTVSAVSEDGSATLKGEAPANCMLHLIYLGSATPASADGLSIPISVNYEGQTGDKNMPAVMLSDGEVKKGKGEFHFTNAGAVIGISAAKGVPSGSTISKITVEGENLSTATIALSGSNLALTATTAADTQYATKGTQLNTGSSDKALSEFADAIGNKFQVKAYDGAAEKLAQTVKWSGSAWAGEPAVYWPQAKKLSFLAYANLPAGASVSCTSDASHTFSYPSLPTDVASQKDALLGYYTGLNKDKSVPFLEMDAIAGTKAI